MTPISVSKRNISWDYGYRLQNSRHVIKKNRLYLNAAVQQKEIDVVGVGPMAITVSSEYTDISEWPHTYYHKLTHLPLELIAVICRQ